MVGIVIIAHLQLAEELLNTAKMVTSQKLDHFRTVSIHPDDHPDQSREKVLKAINQVKKGDGVLIIVDMFGGTPSNLSLSQLDKGKTEIITGGNLPMIIEAANSSEKVKLDELVNHLIVCGQREIRSASEILGKKVRKKEDT